MKTIGTRIRELREERGIKQEYIAERMGISQSSYGRLEKDDNRLTAVKLQSISEILKVSVSVLFGEKATNFIHESNGDNAQAQIGTLIQQDKEHIETLKEEIHFLRKMLESSHIIPHESYHQEIKTDHVELTPD